jgi:hypothetical protein
VAALAFGVSLSALNLWVDPAETSTFGSTAGLVAAITGVGLLGGGGALLIIVTLLVRVTQFSRPLTECLVLALACFAITNSGGFVQFTLETSSGDVAPFAHPAAFITAFIAPPLTGALMGWLYWRIVRPSLSR